MDRQSLLEMFPNPIGVGPDGFVRLIDVMGDDAAVVQAARVSYGAGTKAVRDDAALIDYLWSNAHGTPFEMASIKLHLRVPMDVWRQWVRHRTWSFNEYSTRYSEAIDSMATVRADDWRLQSKGNKQGSDGKLDPRFGGALTRVQEDLHRLARAAYQQRLDYGVAREQARMDLPLSNYTEAYAKVDLRNLLGFLQQRLDDHAQQEIREFAQAIARIVQAWVPATWAAFEEHTLGGVRLSRAEIAALNADPMAPLPDLSKRSRAKLARFFPGWGT